MNDLKNFQLPPNFRGRSALQVQLWWMVQATLFRLSPQFMYTWRNFLLQLFGAKIGKGVIVRPSAKITYPWKLTLGDYVWIGDEVDLYTLGNIRIGNNTVISQRSYICTGSHDFADPTFRIFSEDIQIGSQCWLATDVFVAPGVTIEDNVLVGARSSVFHDLKSGYTYLGSPAKAQNGLPTKSK